MNSNKSDIAIETIYQNLSVRNIEHLAEIYGNKSLIQEAILRILKSIDCELASVKEKRILIKPNWVRHDRKELDELCLTTHPRFTLAILELVLQNKPSEVLIADAPVQGCDWDKLLPRFFIETVRDLSIKTGIPIQIKDWRKRVISTNNNEVYANRNPNEKYILFDMGKKSFLEPITTNKHSFRVTDYDPDRLSESHLPGKHLYCVTKDTFDADYIIALPKAKTHQKTGITNALKLLVGINGDKDYLPHHRVGGANAGGDCYPGSNIMLRLSEYILDNANRHMGESIYKPLKTLSSVIWKVIPKNSSYSLAAGWHGNDTTWRMVMDLNIIAKFGKKDGTIANDPQRDILYLCDGIVGGQGDGPLRPDPLPLGVIMAGTNPATLDYALSLLMGFEPGRIPLVTSAVNHFGKSESVLINGVISDWSEIKKYSQKTLASPGWNDYLNGVHK